MRPRQAAQAQNGACEGRRTARSPACACGDYFWCLVLFCIPVAGLVPMVAWAFSERVCEEKRRLSRAALCLAGIVLAAVLLALALAAVLLEMGAVPCNAWCDGASLPTKRTAPAALRPPGRF